MGVFARLLRRSKATAETPAAEAQTDAAKAGPEDEAAEATETKGTDGAGEAAEPAGEAATEVTESEGVDIPKQQSTEKAADNEAGEGART
ncbi:hypothetical protein SUDANB1_02146 [Streptomyces sp. enrichment culture]|uniref:hypothetical protein n=1 Tax=Streptomyces sp. enrichment culture TaxID=1795815 RepID=UPI003F550635